MLSACENVRKWRVCKPGMHGSPGRVRTLLEGQRGGVEWKSSELSCFCGGIICAAAWLLNRTGHPKDPREDEEQEQYLKEWSRNHGKNEKNKVEK